MKQGLALWHWRLENKRWTGEKRGEKTLDWFVQQITTLLLSVFQKYQNNSQNNSGITDKGYTKIDLEMRIEDKCVLELGQKLSFFSFLFLSLSSSPSISENQDSTLIQPKWKCYDKTPLRSILKYNFLQNECVSLLKKVLVKRWKKYIPWLWRKKEVI